MRIPGVGYCNKSKCQKFANNIIYVSTTRMAALLNLRCIAVHGGHKAFPISTQPSPHPLHSALTCQNWYVTCNPYFMHFLLLFMSACAVFMLELDCVVYGKIETVKMCFQRTQRLINCMKILLNVSIPMHRFLCTVTSGGIQLNIKLIPRDMFSVCIELCTHKNRGLVRALCIRFWTVQIEWSYMI